MEISKFGFNLNILSFAIPFLQEDGLVLFVVFDEIDEDGDDHVGIEVIVEVEVEEDLLGAEILENLHLGLVFDLVVNLVAFGGIDVGEVMEEYSK